MSDVIDMGNGFSVANTEPLGGGKIDCPNGYTISIIWHFGAYSSVGREGVPFHATDDPRWSVEAGAYVTHTEDWVRVPGINDDDDVAGWLSIDALREFVTYVANLPPVIDSGKSLQIEA